MTWLVVGLGDPLRGDDAVGPVIASGIGSLGLEGVDVLVRKDPTGFLDVLPPHRGVVVVHAIPTGTHPGAVSTTEVDLGAGVPCDEEWVRAGRGGSGSFGIAEAVELSRALGRLPERLVLVGVEAVRMDGVAGLSPMVFCALGQVQCSVVDILHRTPVAVHAPMSVPRPRRKVQASAARSAGPAEPAVVPRPRRSDEPMSGAALRPVAALAVPRESSAGH